MSLDTLLETKERIIDTAEADLLNKFHDVETMVYRSLLQYLLQADFTPKKINETFSKIGAIIDEALNNSQYESKVSEYLLNFDKIFENVQKTQSLVNKINIDSNDITKFQDFTVQSTIDKLTGSGIDTNFKQPLQEALYRHIAVGGSIPDAEIILKNYILSDTGGQSTLLRYVSQVSRDALMQYDGAINSRVAQKYNMTARRYVGSIIKDSRGQCVKWVQMGILTDEQLIHEIPWAMNTSHQFDGHRCGGMIEDTTIATFNTYRGGYNCRHSAIPTLSK